MSMSAVVKSITISLLLMGCAPSGYSPNLAECISVCSEYAVKDYDNNSCICDMRYKRIAK